MRDVKQVLESTRKSFPKSKIKPAVLQRMLIFHKTHLPQKGWRSGTRPKSMFRCERVPILPLEVLVLRGWQRASQTEGNRIHSLFCRKFASPFVAL